MADPPAPAGAARAARAASRPVLVAALLLAALATVPYLSAALDVPPGTAFTGHFWFKDDAYNYLSFVQQAEDGAFVFRNKLVLEDHPPALVNLEWWSVGTLSRLLDGRPLVAYRLFAIAAAIALAAGIDRWLTASGVPPTHRLASLLLVATGAGLGGIRYLLGALPERCLDLTTGLFPVLEALANPHFVAGTALLLWALHAHAAPSGARAFGAAALLGTALGLTRPYDLVVLAAVRTLVVVVTGPVRAVARHGAAMAALLPVIAYNYWVFYRQPSFAFYADAAYVFPTRVDFAWALGPAAALAAASLLGRRNDAGVSSWRRSPQGIARLHLAAWCAMGAAVIALRPVHFSLQFLVGLGLPLLALAAVGLAGRPVGWTLAAAAALSTTAIVAVSLTVRPNPAWHVPAEGFAIAGTLRDHCAPGDVLVAPGDIGLWAAGFSACRAYSSHAIEPAHAERLAAVRAFYASSGDPGGRAAFLERTCAAFVVLPADAPAAHFVDERARLEPVAVAGASGRRLAAYRVRADCAPR